MTGVPGDGDKYEWALHKQGIELDRDRVVAAAATYELLRPAIEELRRVPLSFIDPWEPASALAWLESGGEA